MVLTSNWKVPVRVAPGGATMTVPASPPVTPALEMSISPDPLVSWAIGGPCELTEPLPSDSDTCAFETLTSIVPFGSVTVTFPLNV